MISLQQNVAGGDRILEYLNQFWVKFPTWNPVYTLNILGHTNTNSRTDIVICTPQAANIAHFIQNVTSISIKIGPLPTVDGNGHQNWISFKRKIRVDDPRSVARCSILTLLALHNLITW